MANLMDNIPFNAVQACNGNGCDIVQQFNEIRQNPRAFEEHIKKTNPQAYQYAMQIRNSTNPRAIIMNMAQQKGINLNLIKSLGLM